MSEIIELTADSGFKGTVLLRILHSEDGTTESAMCEVVPLEAEEYAYRILAACARVRLYDPRARGP